MRVGLLWYDDDPARDLSQKIARAVSRYQQKFGRRPTVCYVHPSAVDEGTKEVCHLKIAASLSVLRHHFWVGEEESP